ncbi:RNA polymerase sigma factor [Peredibacter starrii]|uniref:RNA polymerase sigma factor n=1 Tax=Peredibacter starrii TaxID=28202 RepID=A0AAX4HJP5_9BACT|nr:RNA polymerase sigma factor [Peredibacter starrii]WPU63455.1 RNA polymerase sigma factor [Peredibacter starrii]
MKTDEQLMREYVKGSEVAFGQLYEKYSPMVYGFIRKRLRTSESEDFYQKVWRQLHEKRHLYQDQPFAPWFFVMMKHLLIDEYRSLGRLNKQEFQDELIEKIYHQDLKDDGLEELLETLPKESQDLVRKYYLEGFSYEELEMETGLSQANLRQRLSRTLRGLRNKLYE